VRDTASGLSRGGLPNFFAFRIEPFAGCAGPPDNDAANG
jgi:hypothetical protein